MEEVYEFGSLAFASMPYRFIYLTLDEWNQAILVYVIKYSYKFIVYFMSLKYGDSIHERVQKLKGGSPILNHEE